MTNATTHWDIYEIALNERFKLVEMGALLSLFELVLGMCIP
jgi:hypothetical protein